MSRLMGLIFAACLLATGTSTSVPAADSDRPRFLTIGTASPGGVYYIYGEELAKILTEKLGIAVNPLPTQGTVHNVKLVDSGGAQLGMITMGVGLQGWSGTGEWTGGKQFRNMRALFPMYDTPFQAAVLRRSGITSLAQLDKKRIGGGPRAGTSGTYVPEILKAVGIAAEISHGSWNVMLTELLAGHDDAFLAVIGAPMPAIQEAEAKEALTFISLSPEQIEAIRKVMPEFSPSKITAGTYRLLEKDCVTIGVYNFGIGRADLPDDLVYQLVKAVFENQPRLLKAHPAARDTLPQNVDKNTFLPFHPGAVSRLTGLIFAACLLAIATSTSVLAADPDWPKSLILGTASPGGVYYIYGEDLAKILTEKLGIAVSPLPTQGPVHNVKLLDSGGARLGLTTMGVGLQGWNGTGDWTNGKQYRNMRALFPMYDTPLQTVVLRRSGIATLAQLDNKRVFIGPRAGTGGTYIPAILKVLGISAEIGYGSFDVAATELLAGRVDAIVTLTGAPVPAVQLVEAKEPVTLISLSPEQIEVIVKAMPEFSPSKIAAGTYRFMDKDYNTIGMYNFGIGRADLPDDLVYQLVKAVFENQPRLVKDTSAASDTIPQNVDKNTFLPFHPGAVRYYREIGISIPDSLVLTK